MTYAAGWLLLLQPSQGLWFLPAGLRLAALWLIPTNRWVWLILGEGLVGCILLWSTKDLVLDLNFVGLSFLPWLVYASVMWLVRGREPALSLSTPRNMLIFLSVCALSAIIVSPILSALFRGDAFVQLSFDLNTWSSIFAFAYGDFIGQLIVAPLLVLVCASQRSSLRKPELWASVFFAAAFSLLVLLLLHYRSELAPFLLMLVFAPMSAEHRQQQSAPLKAVQDRVLALDGEYEIALYEQNLTRRISFQQNKQQNSPCQSKNAPTHQVNFP